MGAQAHRFLEWSHQETERSAIQPSSFAAKWINSLEPVSRALAFQGQGIQSVGSVRGGFSYRTV